MLPSPCGDSAEQFCGNPFWLRVYYIRTHPECQPFFKKISSLGQFLFLRRVRTVTRLLLPASFILPMHQGRHASHLPQTHMPQKPHRIAASHAWQDSVPEPDKEATDFRKNFYRTRGFTSTSNFVSSTPSPEIVIKFIGTIYPYPVPLLLISAFSAAVLLSVTWPMYRQFPAR